MKEKKGVDCYGVVLFCEFLTDDDQIFTDRIPHRWTRIYFSAQHLSFILQKNDIKSALEQICSAPVIISRDNTTWKIISYTACRLTSAVEMYCSLDHRTEASRIQIKMLKIMRALDRDAACLYCLMSNLKRNIWGTGDKRQTSEIYCLSLCVFICVCLSVWVCVCLVVISRWGPKPEYTPTFVD